MEIRKKVSGSTTALTSKSYTVQTGSWYTVKFAVKGSSLSCYINGKLELTATDTAFLSGKVGLTMVNQHRSGKLHGTEYPQRFG